MKLCHGLGGLQTFVVKRDGQIMSSTNCVTPKKRKNKVEDSVQAESCDFSSRQKWKVQKSSSIGSEKAVRLIQTETGFCLAHRAKGSDSKPKTNSMLKFLSNVFTDIGNSAIPVLEPCSNEEESGQLWLLNNEFKWKT